MDACVMADTSHELCARQPRCGYIDAKSTRSGLSISISGPLATSRSMKRREFLGTILAVPLRTLGNSAIEKCYGLLLLGRYGFIGPHKYKTGRHGDPRVGAAILADEY
jgi:hypothetical protein